jgi:hypothetical protein
MRALIVSLFFLLFFVSSHLQAKSLVYVVIDAESSLKFRKTTYEFLLEFLSNKEKYGDTYLYLHIDGFNVHYPKLQIDHIKSLKKIKKIKAEARALSNRNDYIGTLKKKSPKYVEATNPSVLLNNISQNLRKIIKKEGAFENTTLIQFSNLDFNSPVDTSSLIMGDGWLTSPDGPLYEFLEGSQSLPIKGAKVFIGLSNPKGLPLTWYDERKKFIQKLYSSVGATIIGIKRVPLIPYGGGAILFNSFDNASTYKYQQYTALTPKKTNQIQTLDPYTLESKAAK